MLYVTFARVRVHYYFKSAAPSCPLHSYQIPSTPFPPAGSGLEPGAHGIQVTAGRREPSLPRSLLMWPEGQGRQPRPPVDTPPSQLQ